MTKSTGYTAADGQTPGTLTTIDLADPQHLHAYKLRGQLRDLTLKLCIIYSGLASKRNQKVKRFFTWALYGYLHL
jgi:hypothetical protein